MAFENCTSITKFMQSHFMGYDDYGNPLFDRAIDSAQIALFLQTKLKDGIYYNNPAYYKVEPYNGMQVIVRQGFAQIKGKETYIPEDYILTLEPSGASTRVDRIVLQLNINDNVRDVLIVAKKGTTELMRTSTVWELGLADITVGGNISVITSANILDLRTNPSVCGIVDYIYKLDTQSYFNDYLAVWEYAHNYAIGLEQQSNSLWGDINQRTKEIETHWRQLMGELETQTFYFSRLNVNFDDWSVRRGCKFLTSNPNINPITETITVEATGMLLAKRVTNFIDSSHIVTTINFYPWENTEYGNTIQTTNFTIDKVTVFNEDGTISEEVY